MQLWLNPTRDLRVRLIGERVLHNDTTRTQIRPGFAGNANRKSDGPGGTGRCSREDSLPPGSRSSFAQAFRA
mgnify:CR=1 FL=1